MKVRRNITISEDLLKMAQVAARKRSLPLSQYIERLILRDHYDPEKEPDDAERLEQLA